MYIRQDLDHPFENSICISDYLNVLAAARETANHFSSIDPSYALFTSLSSPN